MPNRYVVMALGSMALAVSAAPSRADGMFLPDRQDYLRRRERAMVHEPEQKAAVLYRDGVEDLIISPRYSGPARRFAWIIPVPSRPRVSKLEGALFHELARMTAPPPPKAGSFGGTGRSAGMGVSVLERKQVGAYDVAVLQATDSAALMRWLRQNDFAMVPAAENPIRAHIREGWTFVAARVAAPEAASGLGSGTLAPIRLTFRTGVPVYPLRLSGANPSKFQVLVYAIVTGPAARNGAIAVRDAGSVSWRRLFAAWAGNVATAEAPTLSKLVQGDARIFIHQRMYDPAECTRDITFAWLDAHDRLGTETWP